MRGYQYGRGRRLLTHLAVTLWFLLPLSLLAEAPAQTEEAYSQRLRVATFNVQDVRSAEILSGEDSRLQAAARVIQRIRPDVILLNEIAYDGEGTPAGQNGQHFADRYLARQLEGGTHAIRYSAYTAPCNAGVASGFDLDNDGQAVTDPAPDAPTESADTATQHARRYGNDCWGFGLFPGQYGMALLVREGIAIQRAAVRTFQKFGWSRMPDALAPVDPDTGKPWYSPEEWAAFPLSSKSHWDVPLQLPSGQVLHVLCSHPTPPVFDGKEDRNGCRNHDEIRFWGEYLNNAAWIVDDRGEPGGLASDALFVIQGDLNADPDEGDSRENPVSNFLLEHSRIDADFVPRWNVREGQEYLKLDSDDTASWGMRVDYVLPSRGLRVLDGGIERPAQGGVRVSDHFLVWLDLAIDAGDCAGR